MQDRTDVLILGGGITSLSFASFLRNRDYLILERDSLIGGYCKSTLRNGFVWDYSGHFFHFKHADIKEYVLEKMGHNDEALRCYAQALKLKPNDDFATRLMAEVQLNQ